MEIIDFHNHHIPPRFEEAVVRAAPYSQRARWQAIARKLSALGGVAMVAGLSRRSLKQVFMDTNLCHPGVIRAAVGLLGAGNVIAGSDWPINDGPIRNRLTEAMRQAGLSESEQAVIAAGNCRRLLNIN